MKLLDRGLVALVCVVASVGVIAGAESGAGATHGRLVPASVVAGDFIADIVGPYLAIQGALVNDDLAPVPAAASLLQKGAAGLGDAGASLVAAAAKAGEAKTLEAARAAFGDLSHALIAYADRAKQPIDGKVVAFCPMADKSWVQADGPIANPYYGQAMATCGSAQRRLSATK